MIWRFQAASSVTRSSNGGFGSSTGPPDITAPLDHTRTHTHTIKKQWRPSMVKQLMSSLQTWRDWPATRTNSICTAGNLIHHFRTSELLFFYFYGVHDYFGCDKHLCTTVLSRGKATASDSLQITADAAATGCVWCYTLRVRSWAH